jgi:CspA family cold shock protein
LQSLVLVSPSGGAVIEHEWNSQMDQGVVKFFNDEKGYGFITPDGGGKDVFVHYSSLEDVGGRRTLTDGVRVQFETEPGEKGLQAVNVRTV